MAELIEKFIKEVATSSDQLKHLSRWKEKLGPLFLSAINDVAINKSIAEWKVKHEHAPATSNRYLASLSAAMRSAKKWGWIKRTRYQMPSVKKSPEAALDFLVKMSAKVYWLHVKIATTSIFI